MATTKAKLRKFSVSEKAKFEQAIIGILHNSKLEKYPATIVSHKKKGHFYIPINDPYYCEAFGMLRTLGFFHYGSFGAVNDPEQTPKGLNLSVFLDRLVRKALESHPALPTSAKLDIIDMEG